jgi:hypothetical protein
MADVLESQFSVLLKRIDASANFEELRLAHDVFLNSVTAHTFINNKPVPLKGHLRGQQNFCRNSPTDNKFTAIHAIFLQK